MMTSANNLKKIMPIAEAPCVARGLGVITKGSR